MLTRAELDAITARLAQATPGPWRTFPAKPGSPEPNDCAFGRDGVSFTRDELPAIGECWAETRRGVQDRAQAHANAALIAHAPADLAALVAEVERLTEQLADLDAEATRADYLRGLFVRDDERGVWTVDAALPCRGDLTAALDHAIRTATPRAARYHAGHQPAEVAP